jgi:Putative Ig domain
MSKLSWVTPLGSLSNVLVGVPINLSVLATDDTYSSTPFTYSLIAGSLPPGLTLNSNGTISGVPFYDLITGNYFTQLTFKFVIRAGRSSSSYIDGNFSLILSNSVNQDFVWTTPEGSLGTLPHSEFVSLQLLAEDTSGSKVTYSLIAGELPPGMELASNDVTYDVSLPIAVSQTKASNVITLSGTNVIPLRSTVIGPYIPQNTIVLGVDQSNRTITLSNSTILPITQGAVVIFVATQYTAGTLVGVPTITSAKLIDQSITYNFSVRATNGLGHIRDRSFSLTLTDVSGPVIEPSSPTLPGTQTVYLGAVFDGQFYREQLTVTELNPNASIQWSVVNGSLPTGTKLDSNGLISGYIIPLQLVGSYGPAGYDGDLVDPASGTIIQQQEYDLGPYEFGQQTQSISYNFTVQAYDGANYDLRTYTISVLSRSGFTADSEDIINNTNVTVDASNIYAPIITNAVTTLAAVRQGSYYAFKVEGFDFQGDELTYYLSDYAGTFDCEILGVDDGFDYDPFDNYNLNIGTTTTALPGLTLDESTGWVYGQISPQSQALLNYSFGIYCTKTRHGSVIPSNTIIFTLPVLGDINNTIKWISPQNLGTIDNGSVSELSISAKSTEGRQLVYTLLDNRTLPCGLPQGLRLLTNGDISGRVSFELFSMDDFTTTFDGDKLTFDRTYKFYAQVSTVENDASSTQEFTLTVNMIDIAPYNNVYLQAMPAVDQLKIYQATVNNTEIFVPELIYRPTDPNFGVQQTISTLFLPGLKPEDLNTYELAIAQNHYTKDYTFGSIKTAVVLDELYNVKYEVIYLELLDPELNSDGNGPPLFIDLSKEISNPYIDASGNHYTTIYPNTSQDMIQRLVDNIGYQDQNSLPPWMTSNQLGASGSNSFSPPLGYTRSVVLAYTMPGASKLIAYRLQNSGINFNRIQFTTDRYFVDNYYSTNFNPYPYRYITGQETTFDFSPKNVGSIVSTVNYGVTVAFNQINGRPVSYINANGGIDGKTDWQDGDTIIFIKQEGFPGNQTYDGWVAYLDSYIGDNISTTAIEGYDSEGYDLYSFVPGYLEKIQSSYVSGENTLYTVTNKRGGIWRINIVGNEVGLTFVTEIELNQRIRISRGATYGGAIVYYNPIRNTGQTVPAYSIYNVTISSVQKRTTFNADTTRFFNHRDSYYDPGSNDKYLKFPQTGAFT